MKLLEAYQVVESDPTASPFLCRNNFKHGYMAAHELEDGSLHFHCPRCKWATVMTEDSVTGARMLIRARHVKEQIEQGNVCPACMWVTNVGKECRHPFHEGDRQRILAAKDRPVQRRRRVR